MAVIAHYRDPQCLAAGEGHDGIQPAQASAEQIQRELRAGDVRDDEVEVALTGLQARGLAQDRGRCEARKAGKHLRTDGLPRLLQMLHRVSDLRQAVDGILDADRQRRPHRGDLIAERAALRVGAHGDGNHRLQHETLGVEPLTAKVAPQREADRGEHDVVERAS